jgi:hypothetical protein
VGEGELVLFEIEVPAGAGEVVFELSWKGNWSRYPTNDLDLILIDPGGGESLEGVTSDSPERVVIDHPAAGTWAALVGGFTVFDHGTGDDEDRDDEDGDEDDGDDGRSARERFELRVTADGKRLRLPRADR